MSEISEGIILGVGHPLLDIICRVESTFLDKYGLKADDSIRANDSHQRLYTEITEQFECEYSAGGTIQNSLMTVQWVLNQPNLVTFMGSIGDDHYGKVMTKKISDQGINFVAQIIKTQGTGTSACLLTDNGKSRSLIAYLGASQTKIVGHLRQNYKFVEKAKYFYTSGYQLCVDPESVMEMALHAHNNPGKMFCLNLSAPYVSQKFSKPLLEVFPYVDLLFGNGDDIQAFAQINGWQTKDIKEIVKLSAFVNSKRSSGRTVIITQGKGNILMADNNSPGVREFEVKPIDDNKIVDTIGAGDAFVGGFFAQLVQNKSFDICIKCGIYCAQQVIQQIGCQFPKVMEFN